MRIGTYAVEQDYSHYVAYAAKTVLAIIGTATKGPIGVPTICTSTQDLTNKFGPLHTSHYGLYAGQYFLSQASKMYYIRVAADAAGASTTIPGKDGSKNEITDAITLTMKEAGTYFNGYKVKVETADSGYSLTIKNAKDVVVESVRGIPMTALEVGYETSYVKVTTANNTAEEITASEYTFTGGTDGATGLDSDDYTDIIEALKAESIDMNLIATPGVSDSDIITEVLKLAEERGDCLYLIDPPQGLTKQGVIDWHNAEGDYDENNKLDSSYGALYYDWVNIYDSINKTRVTVPPSVVVAATYAYSDRTTEPWYAPAGLKRGIVRGVLDTETKLSRAAAEEIYSDPNNINPIYEDPQVGLVLWGQKTLQRDTTALNRVNVRRLLNYLKRVITAACNYLTFDANDRITWNSFEMKVLPVLTDVQNKRGLYSFSILKGESVVTNQDIDNYRMPCTIMIQPTKAAEEIPIYFTITSTGADFNSVTESN